MMCIPIVLLIGLCTAQKACAEEKPIIVSIPSYNNKPFYKKNLDSIFAQQYGNFHVIYVDDCSTDGTSDAVASYIKERNLEHKISLIRNQVRRGALYNHYMVAHACPDAAVIVTVDGDDWFPDGNTTVLSRVNEAYQNPNVWMTYGQFAEYPSNRKGFCRPLSQCGSQLQAYRDFPWVMSHLRTYYAGLFKQIPIGYLIREHNFLQATCDLAIMFSLLELSGGRAQCIDDILYIYNTTNGTSDCYTRQPEQIHNDHWIRARQPLTPLTEHPASVAKKGIPILYNWHLSDDGIESCSAYCNSLAVGGIASEAVEIFYPHTQAAEYKPLEARYGVITTGVKECDDCKATLLTQLNDLSEESFILLTIDGCTWHASVDWYESMKTVTKTKALGFVPTDNLDYKQPQLIWLYNQYYLWKPTAAQGFCHHPYASPALLLSKPQLCHALAQINGTTIRELLDNLAYLAAENSEDVVLCNAQPACDYQG